MNFNADDNVEVVAIDNHNHQDANNLPDGAATEEPNHQPASNKSTKILVGGAATALLVIATAFSAASLKSRNSVVSVQAQKVRLPKSSKIPTSKAGKKVCLEYGFETEVIAAGSTTPIGASGPNGPKACVTSPVSAVCCTEAAACALGSPDACDDYAACLRDPANGPVVVGDWWLQRDVSYGEIFFEEDAVCGEITSTDLNSRTKFELWDDTFLGMDPSLFKKFSVGYDFRSTGGGSGGYLNLYLRATDNGNYYDCRLDFSIPNVVGTGTLVVTPETVPSSGSSGCGGTPTIEQYHADNPGAVMGVGNGELYAFVLNTGSTNQDNSGQEICWSDASVQRYDETGAIIVKTWEFTTL